jgi:hypothetical protein
MRADEGQASHSVWPYSKWTAALVRPSGWRFLYRFAGLGALLVCVACSRGEKQPGERQGSNTAQHAASPASAVGAASVASAQPAPSAFAPSPPESAPGEMIDEPDVEPATLEEQRAALFRRMRQVLKLTDEELTKLQAVFARSDAMGQGNPKITRHPMTRSECRAVRRKNPGLPRGDARCGKLNMVPLYDPKAGETPEQAKVCIDQYEFPNIPCDYPVVYARSVDAVDACSALGKRICDAHEWEGACAGALLPAEKEYAFGQRRLMIEHLHNKDREIVWSYGPVKDHLKCATTSRKSPKCLAGGWTLCGSNTFPAGAFPECRSSLGAFDLHGNAAEHMNLPLLPEQLASRGGLGETEMKGSWFIFAKGEAHIDDCRWRAPMWHHTRIDDKNSHANYHLGFRCCRDVGK